jgi:hypothetical protein
LSEKILLGFQVDSGEPVYLGVHHLAIFGMTQLSGKTTALEALISRSGLRAIAFKTKRGEAGFTTYNLVTPYYKPRADWQFVEGLVNVALGEKVKYEPGMRYAIMKVCKGRKDLQEIRQAAIDLAKESKREFMKSVYEKLVAYLDIVVPELEKWRFSEQLELREGVNVMDLSGMRLETQHLVIASTIEYAFAYLDHVVVIIPEAWETIPQGKMTPVKWVAQQFIRKGAAIGNYLWLDSQDIGGIDKTPLRQCDNWLMGRMKEAHEVERILKQLLGMKVPAEEIQTLPLGHFYAAIGNDVKKVYVLPVGVPEDVGAQVARGELTPEYVRDQYLKPVSRVLEDEDLTYKPLWEEEKRKREELEKEFTRQVERLSDLKAQEKTEKLEKQVHLLEGIKKDLMSTLNAKDEEHRDFSDLASGLRRVLGVQKIYDRIAEVEAKIPTSIPTNEPTEKPTAVGLQRVITIVDLEEVRKHAPKVPTDTVKGKILELARDGFFNTWQSVGDISSKLVDDYRFNTSDQAINSAMKELVDEQILGMKHTDRNRWKLAPDVIFEGKKEAEA